MDAALGEVGLRIDRAAVLATAVDLVVQVRPGRVALVADLRDLAAGVPAGPKVGVVMREVEAWWIDADFPDDKLSIIERLKAVAQGLS